MSSFIFTVQNVDDILEAMRVAIDEQVGPAHIVIRGVHWVDRRLDSLIAYWKRKHRGTTFALFGRYADCHPGLDVTVEDALVGHAVEHSREGVLAALAHGKDPRDWIVDAAARERFDEVLKSWKQCVWAGNVQEQMKQPVAFTWALQAPARAGTRPARQSRKK